MTYDISKIRNFSIIAHIDHGKSTLSDRLIQLCNAVADRKMKDQLLDAMDLERERGITIKANTVRLHYKSLAGETYIFNLIDTPGHVDFTYEVSRSLAACEGSLLLVDSTQGVEAQTLANAYLAIENNHEMIPVLNKIDLPSSDVEATKLQIEEVIGLDTSESFAVSGKTGAGARDVLETVISHIPAPVGDSQARLKALLVDSWYDNYLGAVILLRIVDGVISKGDKIRLFSKGTTYSVDRLGYLTPAMEDVKSLYPGEIGFLIGSIKSVSELSIGDTITHDNKPCEVPLPDFRPAVPVVFCGLYPTDSNDFEELKQALTKLALNDASFCYEAESSPALGFGFRCGFLGLLHMEVIQERLEREFDLDLVTTAPSVVYRIHLHSGESLDLHNPSDMPEPPSINYAEEPWIKGTIMVPEDYVGAVIKLCQDKRGEQSNLTYVGDRVMLEYRLPLAEVVFDFYDRLKSVSRGYASFDYQADKYERNTLVKVAILVNGEPVDALSMIVHRSRAESRGRALCTALKELIPRQLFKVAIQAAIGGKIIARETVPAMRKDVTAKCYGGDISRKRKLLDKQKKGKKRMKQFGNVEIPQSAFLAALKVKD